MVEAMLADSPLPGVASVFGAVRIAPAAPMARYSVRSRDAAGLPRILASAPIAGGTALGLGPDEWLLLLPEGAPLPTLEGVHAATDIAHRNIGIVVEGPAATALILTGCALDLDRDFPVGKVTRTVFEGVEMVLWRTAEDRFHIEVWRSFAGYLWSALVLAAGDLPSSPRA